MLRHISTAIAAVAVATLFTACGGDDPANPASSQTTSPDAAPSADADAVADNHVVPYPLETCLVSGEPLGAMGEPKVLIHEGRELKFCCPPCTREFEADPAAFIARVDTAAAQGATSAPADGHQH